MFAHAFPRTVRGVPSGDGAVPIASKEVAVMVPGRGEVHRILALPLVVDGGQGLIGKVAGSIAYGFGDAPMVLRRVGYACPCVRVDLFTPWARLPNPPVWGVAAARHVGGDHAFRGTHWLLPATGMDSG